ncbi:pimeloyl-ACP methyl ester carboxylesterase [Lactobacillus colini]|uniref:Pimeloyl-ACP methyl ester carboxylesterase n=1 Tax=Lactobacillus colini TaxID=1819254 RepID=A0ABS4MDK3_9LACO|nr:alpha/beta hydrolase [Lactobacillus colini]MBP2057469.1 pimeloyl-ACP methyl ester carboxylesterase [Lactobacillus colini]
MKITVNGVELYYQKIGQGHPLILLHGHHQDGAVFDKLISPLSLYYTVYVPDMRGHGLSGGEASEHYQTDVEDMVSFIKQLGLKRPYILGYGAGGVDGLWLASKYPDLVNKLIIAGTYVNGNGVSAGHIMSNSFKRFFRGDRDSRVAMKETKILPQRLAKITTPTLCVVGEKDWVKIEHVRWYSAIIPNCRLIVMPRQSHTSYVVHSLKLLDLIKDFCK